MTTCCVIIQKSCVILGYYAGVAVRIKNYDYLLRDNSEERSSQA